MTYAASSGCARLLNIFAFDLNVTYSGLGSQAGSVACLFTFGLWILYKLYIFIILNEDYPYLIWSPLVKKLDQKTISRLDHHQHHFFWGSFRVQRFFVGEKLRLYHQRAPNREELWRRFNETMMRRAEKEQLAYENMMLKRKAGKRIEDVNVGLWRLWGHPFNMSLCFILFFEMIYVWLEYCHIIGTVLALVNSGKIMLREWWKWSLEILRKLWRHHWLHKNPLSKIWTSLQLSFCDHSVVLVRVFQQVLMICFLLWSCDWKHQVR